MWKETCEPESGSSVEQEGEAGAVEAEAWESLARPLTQEGVADVLLAPAAKVTHR